MNIKAIIIIGLLAALSGAAKAVQDTVTHHYEQSIFLKSGTWWNPAESWKAKYEDYDAGKREPAFLFSTTVLVSLTDAWHAFGMINRFTLLCAGIYAGIMSGRKSGYTWRYWTTAWYWFVFIMVAASSSFHVCYTWLFV